MRVTPNPIIGTHAVDARGVFLASSQDRGVGPRAHFSVLIGCEYSATERDEFRARGFDAWSCDLKPSEGDPRWHIHGDVQEAILAGVPYSGSHLFQTQNMEHRGWDMIILHVDCTAMGVCGNKHYGRGKPKHWQRIDAIDWTLETVRLALANAPRVMLENPASVIFPILRRDLNADVQYIQPWQHGHPEQKKTGLALWGLPRLTETNNVYEHMMTLPRKERERIFFMSPGADRGHERSRAYPGIARAMADQWGQSFQNTRHGLSDTDRFSGSDVPFAHEVTNELSA